MIGIFFSKICLYRYMEVLIIRMVQMRREASGWGQMIVHRAFDTQLPEMIQHVPIFTIKYEGRQHAVGTNKRNRVEARAKCIAERPSIAWDFMDRGGYLYVAPSDWIADDDWELRRLQDTYRPDYEEPSEEAPEIYPAIYVSDSNLGTNRLRIMTIYPHHLLFCRMSTQVNEYDKLEISRTREGRIFKEIAIRLAEVAPAGSDREALKDALARIAMSQRDRLVGLAKQAPRDWRLIIGDNEREITN